eukprot:12396304-Ditylum_brightwellii.AAC.1
MVDVVTVEVELSSKGGNSSRDMAVAGRFCRRASATFVLTLLPSCGFSDIFCRASAFALIKEEMLVLARPG